MTVVADKQRAIVEKIETWRTSVVSSCGNVVDIELASFFADMKRLVRVSVYKSLNMLFIEHQKKSFSKSQKLL